MYKNIFNNKEDQKKLREAGKISAQIISELKKEVKEGVTPNDINNIAEELCKKYNVTPSFKGTPGPKGNFPGSLCVSVNDETLHTIPFSKVSFKSGDIISLDFGIIHKGFFTDHCITLAVGTISDEEKRLITTAELCVETAIKQARAGNKIGDISNALETITLLSGFNYIEGYAGHGIGKELWVEPQIPYFGDPDTGVKLVPGMVFCIENQITTGSGELTQDKDGWTLRTADGHKSAMFEHMVLIQPKGGAEVLTRLPD